MHINDNNQWIAPPHRATLQQSTLVIGHHIGPQTRALEPKHIGHRRLKIGPIKSEISLPRLDVLPDGAVPQPQASLLPQS